MKRMEGYRVSGLLELFFVHGDCVGAVLVFLLFGHDELSGGDH